MQPHILRNARCPYCGRASTDQAPLRFSMDHVIGRRFVPRGALNNNWNLILQACDACNNLKSDLEDELSALSMIPDAGQPHSAPDHERLADELARKMRGAYSRTTKKPIGDSSEELKLNAEISPGLRVTLGLASPPRFDELRVYQLALLQLRAFWSFVSYRDDLKSGLLVPTDQFYPIVCARRGDWGNDLFRGFEAQTDGWDYRLIASTAEGFFKVALRRHPTERYLASWAFEWNKSLRTIGIFGRPEPVKSFISKLPRLKKLRIVDSDGTDWLLRREVPLSGDDDDRLFDVRRPSGAAA